MDFVVWKGRGALERPLTTRNLFTVLLQPCMPLDEALYYLGRGFMLEEFEDFLRSTNSHSDLT